RDVLAEQLILIRKQNGPAKQADSGEHDNQRGKDALHTPGIKIEATEIATRQRPQDDPRDQEPGDDEEDIDTGESAGKQPRERVEGNDRKNRDRAQAIN